MGLIPDGHRKRNYQGYILVKCPKHPRARNGGYVAEHILVAEKALGKYLPKGAVVHHIDGDKANNRNDNLILCQNHSYHALIHLLVRGFQIKDNAGRTNLRYCFGCSQWKEFSTPLCRIRLAR